MSGWLTDGMTQATVLTGNELVPLDTQLTSGQNPATYAGSVDQISNYSKQAAGAKANFRNLLDGGDFELNPWQRGTGASANITTTVTYQADRWFAIGGANSQIVMSQVSSSAGAIAPGLQYSLQWGRSSTATGTSTAYLGQVLESADSYRAQGQMVMLSFYAASGAGFATATGAGTSGLLTAQIYSGTGTNASASSFAATSWTSQTLCNSVAAGVTGAITTVPITSTWTRFYVLGKVPTNAAQLGVLFSYTPLGTAAANEYVQFAGVQLEIVSPNATQANAASYASVFEFRDVQVELEIAQRYYYQLNEGSAGVIAGNGLANTASTGRILVSLPVQMRIAPTLTTSIGTFGITNGAAASQTITTLAAIANGHSVNGIGLAITTSGTLTIGQGALLVGGGGTGNLQASADF